jgi:hypothetical protein
LLEFSCVENRDPIRDLKRLLLIVRHQQTGNVNLVLQPAKPAPQLLANFRVQCPEGLVEQ